MILDGKKYVPILKWKRAEQSALRDLTDSRKDVIMPIIELVMPKPKQAIAEEYHDAALALLTDEKIADYVNSIDKSWGKRPFFLDFTWIYKEAKEKTTRKAIDSAISEGLKVVPVINMFDDATLIDTVLEKRNEHSLDVALRISGLDLEDMGKLNRRLTTYLGLPHSQKNTTHLIVDLKELPDEAACMKYAVASQGIIHLDGWKSLTLASGAFPVDLSECSREEPTLLPRNDWLRWKKFADTLPKRVPTFADYGIRHPLYFESHLVLHPTTSIKYTLTDSWIVYKGKVRKFGDYLANASTLTTTEDYLGENYSAGDMYIKERADHFSSWAAIKLEEEMRAKDEDRTGKPVKSKATGTGSTETWLSAGFNHHMSVAADQVSS